MDESRMECAEPAVYKSAATLKSLGNEYSIFADRIELNWGFPLVALKLIIHRDDLVSIGVFKPPVIRTTFWALKLDLADLHEHVGIQRRSGIFKQLRFTPEKPKEFISRAKETLMP